jgi:competence protein ComEA
VAEPDPDPDRWDADPDDLDLEPSGIARWSPHALTARAHAWLAFVGPARVASGIGAAVVVVGVGAWLLRTPAEPTEARLPYASVTTAAPPASSPPAAAAPAPSSAPATLVVYVTGAVRRPGVYRLGAGERVADAIDAAGGADSSAAADAINLAAPLRDGDRVDVPTMSEVAATPFTTLGVGVVHAVADTGDLPRGPTDLNRATVEQLEALPGIGPATAAAIIRYRSDHGAFAAVDELEAVPGIGPAKLAALRGLVAV